MPSILVIHDPADRTFVEERLIKPLPALGYERWRSSDGLRIGGPKKTSLVDAMEKAAAIIAVVSTAVDRNPFSARVALARASGRPTIVVRVGAVEAGSGDEIWATLPSLPAVDDNEKFWRELLGLLPPLAALPPQRGSSPGDEIRWDEALASSFLRSALGRHDYSRTQTLIGNLERHLSGRGDPYPAAAATTDLKELRKRRQFSLMARYGEAVLRSGVTDFTVRKLYGQALIELGKFPAATKVLNAIVAEAGPTHPESYEARGLLGRVYKQQYVNAPQDRRARDWLSRAIQNYASVYDQDHEQVWHGINAASLLHRASRDGVAVKGDDPARATTIARDILQTLKKREEARPAGQMLEVWDCATRVEALIAVGELAETARALDLYLSHPDMQAFEVSSTCRQFAEVLQLGDRPEGKALMEKLWGAVERHRAGGSAAPELTEGRTAGSATRSMLLRVSDPEWVPGGVPDLEILVRLGTVLSITGSESTVRALLSDPSVIGVEDSRPVMEGIECVRSLPFIKVMKEYTGTGGSFSETGDHAILAVIDNGIDVLHKAFQDDAGQTRILGIWDQRDSTGPAPEGFGLGTFHDQAAIQQFIAAGAVPAKLTRNPNGHGTHVASIAAGRAVGQFAGGVAPGARLLIVIPASAEAIGYSGAHIAALDFIKRFAAQKKMPVVVNLSQGMNAGAHDGRSALEVAFDEFANGGRAPGRIVVKSAGNERGKRGHATAHVAHGGADSLTWRYLHDPAWNRDRLEVWWDSANSYSFRLTAPSGVQSAVVDESHPADKGQLAGGGQFLIELVKRHPDNGDSRLVVELGSGSAGDPITEGDWMLDIVAVNVRNNNPLHAWLERGSRRPSEFVDGKATEEMTLSVPGTAFSVITVGAVDASAPIRVGTFSSFGPTRDGRSKPDVVAPGVKVIAACGGTEDGIREDSGTSMAAPHVAGAIALLLSRAARAKQPIPTASQVGAAIRQMTATPGAAFMPNVGFGVIDVSAFLTGF